MEFDDQSEKHEGNEIQKELVGSNLQLDNMYNALQLELHVISEEDQTSYRETNLSEYK